MFALARPAASRKSVLSQPVGKTKTFPAPSRGWIANENLADPKPGGAAILDNWFPTATGVRLRKGSNLYATAGSGIPIGALMPYVLGGLRRLFAANTIAIYDITAPASATVSPAAVVSGRTNGDYSHLQFATPGGTFLIAVNGADQHLVYDGTSWATNSPAITGVSSATFSAVWSFGKRLFFVQKNTMDAWYLPVDAIGGAATKLPLGGVFTLGGSLLFGATWSIDAGNGLTQSCVFVTTEGEVAVYDGLDPASTSTWSLRGVYRIGRPLGVRAWMRAGGDLVIATDIGMIPLSQAIQRDFAALGLAAVSYPVETAWNATVAERSTLPWHVEIWPTASMVVIATPSPAGGEASCLVVNARTGAWCRYRGWDARSIAVWDGRLFFGTADGRVSEGEVGGLDAGLPYSATWIGLFDPLGAISAHKTAMMGRVTMRSIQDVGEQISVAVDWNTQVPTAPSAAPLLGTANDWDAGLWNQLTWQAGKVLTRAGEWRSTPAGGVVMAPVVQVTSGSAAELDCEIVSFDLRYEGGGIAS
jgi:hypothetical protein